jgi:hypothetical protein
MCSLNMVTEPAYDLLTLSETWIQDVNSYDETQYSDLGYNIYISPRMVSQGGGVGHISDSLEVSTWCVWSDTFFLLVKLFTEDLHRRLR